MSEKNDKIVKLEVIDDNKLAQNEMIETLIESVLPMIQPLIKPATKKFTDFMNEGNMILIKSVKGEVNAFHMKISDVDKFEMKPNTTPVGIYNLEDLVAKILSGDFGK